MLVKKWQRPLLIAMSPSHASFSSPDDFFQNTGQESELLDHTDALAADNLPTLDQSCLPQTLWQWVSNWIVIALAGSCASTSFTVMALLALITPPPETDCTDLQPRASDRAQLTCLQAEIAAGQSDAIVTALDWVGRWEHHHPLYNEAQMLLDTWSTTVLRRAQRYQDTGNIIDAIALVNHIPPASPRYRDAQRHLQQLHDLQKQATHQDASYPTLLAAYSIHPERRQQFPAVPGLQPRGQRLITADQRSRSSRGNGEVPHWGWRPATLLQSA